jgi:hypothetical protein
MKNCSEKISMPPETPRLRNHATGGKPVDRTDSNGYRDPKAAPTRKRKLFPDKEVILDTDSESERLCRKSPRKGSKGILVRLTHQEKQPHCHK